MHSSPCAGSVCRRSGAHSIDPDQCNAGRGNSQQSWPKDWGKGEGQWTKAPDDVLRYHISFAKSLCSPVNMSPLALTVVMLSW